MRSILTLAGLALLLLVPGADATQGSAATDTTYRVGPGDVLEVVVEGRPDLSRLPTVQTTGEIFLPRAGDVRVEGLSTVEIADRVASLLADEIPGTPRVSVAVKEFHSQFVWVYGQVLRPGRKPLRSGTRLVDALLDAGGFSSRASGEVRIERRNGTFADGRRSLAVHFDGGSPTPEELHHLGLRLENGDMIVASIQNWVIVSGEVSRPGRYPIDDNTTLGSLIEEAGGLTPFGSERVTVQKDGAAGVEVDLKAVRSGKAVDPALSPGDQVVVSARRL